MASDDTTQTFVTNDTAAEALARWESASPDDVDAWYNAGQARYNRGEYALALAHWQRAAAADPEDFEVKKKIVQAKNALGPSEEDDSLLDSLRAAWASSTDPEVQKLDAVVIDQFTVRGRRVMALETLRPRSADLWYALTWQVTDSAGRVTLTVQLETSAYGRERGVPFLLGMNTAKGHSSLGPMFKARPPYGVLRPMAIAEIEKALADG